MKNKITRIIISAIMMCIILFIVVVFSNIQKLQKETVEEIRDAITEIATNEVVVSKQTEELLVKTKDAIVIGEDLSTTEVIESSAKEEQEITDESALETDAVVDQENISYDGTNTGNGLSLLGSYQGLTYYSQADSRWANVMYSSINNKNQTMKTSACGPTSVAMVVSSSKGTILPTTIAQLSVDNGYRTKSSGTAWSFYSFVADYFEFKEYYITINFNAAMNYLKQDKDNDGNADYYIITSCGSGLFTTGGHYIVLVANNNGTITVYDPYLYSGKFTTASRKNAGVVVSGNSVFVSETSFKKYANYKCFWIFSNDKGNGNSNTVTETKAYTRYVATQSSNLNVRKSASTSSSIITTLKKGTKVTVTKTNGSWSKISSPVSGWVNSSYLSSTKVTSNVKQNIYQVNCNKLNIRTSYSTKSKVVGIAIKGIKFNILETKKVGNYTWGRAIQGWICLNYCKKI